MNPYFPHESNARDQEKIIVMRMQHGWEGYGIYWAIIEKLRIAEGYRLTTDYRIIAYDLRVDVSLIESIVNDFGLFKVVARTFHSPSLCLQMEWKDERSSRARRAATLRWKKGDEEDDDTRTDECKPKPFVPPTLEAVSRYCHKRNSSVDPAAFIGFYESKGWMVGTNPMKNWMAAIRRWEAKDKTKQDKDNDAKPEQPHLHPALQ